MRVKRINVLIVDDQTLFRENLAMAIDANERYKLAGEFADGYELIQHLPALKPHRRYVALVDLQMPGINGIELNQILQQNHPNIKVIILSVHYTPILVAKVIQGGAAAFLSKNCSRYELNEAIEIVAQNGVYHNEQVTKIMEENPDVEDQYAYNKLSEREIEVLKLICAQFSSAEIAERLELSIRTVDRHRETMLAKTKAINTAGLVIYAITNNIYHPQGYDM